MDYGFKQTLLSRCLLSGLLAGIIAVVINFVYNYVFREATSYSLSEVINIPSLILSSLIVELAAGGCYYLFLKLKRGKIIYMIVFTILIILGIYAAMQTQRSDNAAAQNQFRMLFAGVILIDGLMAEFLIPYLTNHDKLYS